MIPLVCITVFIAAIAVPMFLEEQKKEEATKLRNKEQVMTYGDNPFAPNGAFEPGLIQENPLPDNMFGVFGTSEHDLPNIPEEPCSGVAYHTNPLFEMEDMDTANRFLEFHSFDGIALPEIRMNEDDLRQIAKVTLYLSMAYEAGVQKIRAGQVIAKANRGSNKRYELFQIIWDEIRSIG